MTILQSTIQTLTKSMPSIFDNKNSIWPYPEQSIGEECSIISGLRCWLPIGPALAAFEVLAKDIQDLLDKHKDALMQGEPKPRAISFNMWMTGSKPGSSSPTIVFSSKSPRQRLFAKALLKDSKLLDQYPGVRIKTLDRMPAIYQAGSQEPDPMETTRNSTENGPNDGSEEAIYMVDDSRGSCGALIAFGHSRLATMGGILLINNTYYGISAQHGRYEYLEEPEDSTKEGTSLCFDDDSDAEDSDLDNLIEITSKESISSYTDEGTSTLSFASTTSPKDRIFEYPSNIPSTTESTLDHTPQVPSPSQPTFSSNPKISKLLPFERNDLDYEVFEIDDPRYHSWNKIDLPSSGHPIRHILPNRIARTLVECPVWAATGTTGCVQGTMMKQTHYIKMEGSETFQEMWAVKLDRNTKPGDSGAWVVDTDGQIYGHIVAGDPMLGLAFITPAYKVFDDIKRRFGSEVLCCPSSSTMQPYNALQNNGSRSDLSVVLKQTWAPSRSFRRSDNPSLDPTHRTFLMISVLLSVPLYVPWADHGIVFICFGGLITYITLQAASELSISIFPIASYLPFANGSVVFTGICQVAFVIASPLAIIQMCPYMSIQSWAGCILAGRLIRNGHELQIRVTWFVTSLGLGVSALSASNSALYLASRALYGMIHLRQYEESARIGNRSQTTFPNFTQVHLIRLLQLMSGDDYFASVGSRAYEEDARFWDSQHIISSNLTRVLPTRSLQLMCYKNHSEWQWIAHGGRHARTNMYLVCWAEQCLQTLGHRVAHQRVEFYRGNLLGTSMIMTGTSKQLMTAAFSAETSAKTPSFGSRAPSKDVQTHIGRDQETTNDAAVDRKEPIECILGYRSVHWAEQYMAVSYVWGNPKESFSIQVDGRPFKVTEDSRAFSAAYRTNTACPVLGIDHVWIDQNNISERKEQIQLMKRVFECAFIRDSTWLDIRRPRTVAETNRFLTLDTFARPLCEVKKGRNRDEALYLGSVKANIGHGEAASGVTSLIKVLPMLKKKSIVLHCGIKSKIDHKSPNGLEERNAKIALKPISRDRSANTSMPAAKHELIWYLLERGTDTLKIKPKDRFDEAYSNPAGHRKNTSHTPYGCSIDEPELFDPSFFHMSPREATETNPMHRLALLTAYEALEMSSSVSKDFKSSKLHRVGTYYGPTIDAWGEIQEEQDVDASIMPGGLRAFAPTLMDHIRCMYDNSDYTNLESFLHENKLLDLVLWRDKEHVSAQIKVWYCCNCGHVVMRLGPGAVPAYDARQRRRYRLNAGTTCGHCQCSESRERG